MISARLFRHINIYNITVAGLLLILLSACTIVRKYPKGKPFVYKTKINLIGKFTNQEKKLLVTGLEGQLDDSMQARRVDKLIVTTLKSPPVFDSTNADNSIQFMKALLRSLGYFNDSIYYTTEVKLIQPDQHRTFIDFYVEPGKLVHLDTVTYNMLDSGLQRVTDSTTKDALIKKGDPFAKIPISNEIERLTELYKNTGYFKFTRDEIIGVWDTLDVSLLQPSIDPFEQLEVLQKLKARSENPTAKLEMRLKNLDSTKLTKFYLGTVTLYPDYVADTLGRKPKETLVGKDNRQIKVLQYGNSFHPKIFPDNVYLPRDSLYKQSRYIRTLNRFNTLGTWRLVTIDQIPRKDQDTVDFIIKLTPAKKYSFNASLEGSINQSVLSGNLFGIGVNTVVQNRNFARGANNAATNARYGVELGGRGSNQFIQTQQVSVGHTITFPRLLPRFGFIPAKYNDNFRTLLSFNAANQERRFIYNLGTLNGSWGYEFQRRRNQKNMLLLVKIPNIEFSHLVRRDSLDTLIKYNPSLKNIFTDGFIASVVTNFTISNGPSNGKWLNVLRMNFEESGLLAGMIRNSFLDKHLYRFIKLDAEFARLVRFTKSSVAMRAFAGAGYEFNSTRNPDKRSSLPFFKQYFSGGPNSMRAWALRRLGPGSVVREFNGEKGFPDRYGDIQLEANIEYRFPIGTPFGVKVNGAVFTDVGNTWYWKKAAGRLDEEVFNINRLGKDIAIGSGAGLRVDFDFFVIRFDYGYRIKDPSPSVTDAQYQNKWFSYPFFRGSQFQLGIGYPFIF